MRIKARNASISCRKSQLFVSQQKVKLNSKIENLFHLLGSSPRSKRWLDQGIAPGLSTILKFLIGTPDAYDKLTYDEALKSALTDS